VKTETTIHTTVYGVDVAVDIEVDHDDDDYRVTGMKAVDSDLYGVLSERLQGAVDFAADGILRDGPVDPMDIVKAAKERHLDRGEI